MKLSKNNVFVNKVLVWDVEKELVLFGYECDHEVPRVLVTKTPEVTVQDFGGHCYVIPFEFDSEEQFNKLAIESLLEACRLSKNLGSTVLDAKIHFLKKDYPYSHALVSKDFSPSKEVSMELYNYFWEDAFYADRYISKVDGLKPNQILFTPEPEYIGVISTTGENADKYGIGIINSAAPILVELP